MPSYQRTAKRFLKAGFLSLFCLVMFTIFGVQIAFAEGEIKVIPYGHVELDTIYSSRETNPLDPAQFNGYITAAGPGENDSSSFNSRFLLLGIKSEWRQEALSLITKGEFDFWGSDKVGLTAPRLRLASINYGTAQTRFIVGQDWSPVMTLNPNALDFSIMGYGGNLWQRIPQITVKHSFDSGVNVTATTMRFERSAALGPFADTMRMPFVGGRIGFAGPNNFIVALSGVYRTGKLSGNNETVVSQLAGVEASVPVGTVVLSGELAQGKALGAEFFRFGQDFNGIQEITTQVGWIDLGYAPKPWGFHAGYGFDNPKDADLNGLSDTAHYLNNQRLFINATYSLSGGLGVGAEYTYVVTEWSNKDKFTGNQVMVSFFYDF